MLGLGFSEPCKSPDDAWWLAPLVGMLLSCGRPAILKGVELVLLNLNLRAHHRHCAARASRETGEEHLRCTGAQPPGASMSELCVLHVKAVLDRYA